MWALVLALAAQLGTAQPPTTKLWNGVDTGQHPSVFFTQSLLLRRGDADDSGRVLAAPRRYRSKEGHVDSNS